ncbi:unnamed protein product [Paramecium octaurelia]|uniref:Uncharacterized protein n=1 Tax=Paramecium octaurelia TaxID=43137 RepID=A0A8S1SCB7_PAROT|nr:unnamed protein product [Paramecium octaurelia]
MEMPKFKVFSKPQRYFNCLELHFLQSQAFVVISIFRPRQIVLKKVSKIPLLLHYKFQGWL